MFARGASKPAQEIAEEWLDMEEKNMLASGCGSKCARECTDDVESYMNCSEMFLSADMYWIENICGCNKIVDVKFSGRVNREMRQYDRQVNNTMNATMNGNMTIPVPT